MSSLIKGTAWSALLVFMVFAQFLSEITANANEKPAPMSIDTNHDKPGVLDTNASIDESKEKIVDKEASGKYWSKNQMQLSVYQSVGRRHATTEDRYDVQRDEFGNGYFAVYDGHGGSSTSSLLQQVAIREYISPVIRAYNGPLNDKRLELDYGQLKKDLKEAVLKLEDRALKTNFDGSTLNMVVNTAEYLIAINLGDSRSVMVDPFSQTFPLTQDHKPDSPYERERIVRFGSHVSKRRYGAVGPLSTARVGPLALSRSVGDVGSKLMKNVVSGMPDVFIYAKNNDKNYNKVTMILVATDGIWDVMRNDKATELLLNTYCKRDNIVKNLANQLGFNDGDQSKYLNRAVTQLGQKARETTPDDITIVAAILDNKICQQRVDY